jgi:enterochelin esterase-like enzyme
VSCPRRTRRLGGRRALIVVTTSLAVALAGCAAVVFARARHAPATATAVGGNIVCPSPSLGGSVPAIVYLPPRYRHSSLRYPVVYFLHGLPAQPTSYENNDFIADAVEQSGHRAIVVAPQGARSANSDREYLNWGPRENWPAAIADDLTRCIDARYRTIASRAGRALVGLSAGGFGAFNIGLRRLDTFAAVESWSGYFAATDPTGLRKLNLGSPLANRKAHVPRGRHLRARLQLAPTFIGFFVGRQDTRFLQANIMLDQALTRHAIPHRFAVYPGGHSAQLWRTQAPNWLGAALNRMSAPR